MFQQGSFNPFIFGRKAPFERKMTVKVAVTGAMSKQRGELFDIEKTQNARKWSFSEVFEGFWA